MTSDDIVDRKQEWWSMDTVQRATYVDDLTAEIERLRAELQEFHDGTKRHDLAPEDVGMVRFDGDAAWPHCQCNVLKLWRFPDEQQ